MNDYLEAVAIKRSVLLGARIRFSPSGAIVRQQAIERIIEQNLVSAEGSKGLTENQLRELITLGGKMPVLRAFDVKTGLDSLIQSGRVRKITNRGKRRYVLSEEVKQEIQQILSESEERNRNAINALFGTAPGGAERYEKAFLRLLCLVFSKLSEVYVQTIAMRQAPEDLVEHKSLSSSIDKVLKSERVPDANAFQYGVNRFFRESSPQFDQLKWNMTQNFYVAKALGIDDSADLLSSDVFKDASLYCDTNVLIAGLMPENRHHNSFQELAKACKGIRMELKVAHNTVKELRGVINAHASLLRKVYNNIPSETQPKVRDFLFEAYLAEKETVPELSLDDFLVHFQKPLQTLRSSFGLIEEDDKWFDDIARDQATKRLAKDLVRQYVEMRGRPKLERAAVHDAVLLQWVARENTDNRKSWVVTLDVTLAKWNAQQIEKGFRAITLDALLQWMTPMMSGLADEGKLAEIFAEVIRYHLLPKDMFFQLRDFQVFAEMGIETKQLPADDVEACIREIKTVGPHLDPSKAADREKMGQVIQRYFADPGTKYQRTIHDLQVRTDELTKMLEDESRLRKNQEKQARQMRLVISAVLRSLLTFFLLVAVEGVVAWLAWRYGDGENFFQKLTNSWSWLVLGFGTVAVVYPFIMGRNRMRLLKWWKGDSDYGEPSK